ncbi:MAG: hypothetical protein KDD89_13215, partial [Anaerolineales bacterium]|nr:hypothetical protein [Anaerolineales bacterium]
MLSPAEIKQKARRKYNAFLRSLITKELFFPLEVSFGRPKSTADYATLRREVTQLRDGSKEVRGFGYTIEWQTTQTRQYGTQTLPQKVYFETAADYLRLLGKQKEAERFDTAVSHTLTQFPLLRDWLIQYPQRVIKWLAVWPDLLTVCAYFVAQPPPHGYIRELPIPVHTKFIEENEAILRYLLDELLPAEAVQQEAMTFAERFYLRQVEPLVRLRLLDGSLQKELGWPSDALGLPLTAVAENDLSAYTIVIIENQMTYLTFPALPRAIAIWGQGYSVLNLARVSWLNGAQIYYWGDLDVQGFEILAGLRAHFPAVQSLLMGTETLAAFQAFVVAGVSTAVDEPT